MPPSGSDRRRFLATVAGGMSLVVAGCSETGEDSDGGTTPEATPESTETPTATETPVPTETPTPEPIDTDLSFTHPETVQMDEPFDITVEGLPSETTVEVVMEGTDSDGGPFESLARVETQDGSVSLGDSDVAVEAEDTAIGVDPGAVDVGLPMAMIQLSDLGYQDREAWWPADGTRDLTYEIRKNEQTLGSTAVRRHYPDYTAGIDLDHPDLVGRVYEPTEQASGPGVLLLHGSGGDASVMFPMAATLALRGYTAFALDYFTGDGLPDELIEIPLEYFQRAAEWLLDYETTISDEIGIVGTSYGGMTGLLVGSTFDAAGPVVSIAGSGVVFEGINTDGYTEVVTSTYTLDGEPVPYVPLERRDFAGSIESADDERLADATIPVEEIDGRVLLLSGADDTLWNSELLNGVAEDRLSAANHPDFEHRVYPDTGHFFRLPYQPVYGADYYGGSLDGIAEASHDYWQAILETLSTIA